MIPTRDRPRLLHACLQAIIASTSRAPYPVEVVVVDDGSRPPLQAFDFPVTTLDITLLRLEGAGPASARNEGLRRARGDIVLFTDDDTVPLAGWIEATARYLNDHPDAVGVEGPVSSPDWDPLVENSIRIDGPGHHVTCNIAYRRGVLLAVGGFREGAFRYAHAEDRDVAARCLKLGPIGFEPEMEVVHTPRATRLRAVMRQARWVRDDIVLFAFHPEMTRGWRMPVRVALVWGTSSRWLIWAAHGNRRSASRLLRGLAAFLAAGAVGTWSAVRTPPAAVLRRRADSSGLPAPGTLARSLSLEAPDS